FKKWNAGDIAGARAVNSRMLERFAYETGDDNPTPLPSKVMMNHLGLDVGEARLPMGPPPNGLAERAEKVFSNLQAARAAATK
ncbi:MAG: 4-hydroxy-tetrahydrodipicolinate synthase, partial [Acidimicrobiaceae bacterium]